MGFKTKEVSQITDVVSTILPIISTWLQYVASSDIGNLANAIFSVMSIVPALLLITPII